MIINFDARVTLSDDTCRKEGDATQSANTEAVFYHSVGPDTSKLTGGIDLYAVNPMNQVNQYAEVSSPYTEIGELEDRQGKERALSNGQHKNSNHSEVSSFSFIIDSIAYSHILLNMSGSNGL